MDKVIVLLIIVAAILYTVTVILIVNAKNKLKNYDECTGTIKSIYENASALRVGSKGHEAVSPVVGYTVGGADYEFTGNYYSTSMKVGQEVKVLYKRDDYSKAAIKAGVYLAPIITGVLAAAFTLPIIICIVLTAKGIV